MLKVYNSKRAKLRHLVNYCTNTKPAKWSKREYLGKTTRGQYYKDELFNILGHRCKMCGITDKRLLIFDHINNDGYKDRRGLHAPTHFYSNYVGKPIFAILNLQVLCCNCNILKTYTSGHNKHLENTKFNI